MREIKFRAWHKQEKDMYHFINFSGVNDYYNGDLMTLKCGFPDELVLMQYTGLKDKNGKEIYEGDIVKYCEEYIQEDLIKWSNGIIEYGGSGFKIDGKGELDFYGDDIEIIGNVYQNKDLLK